MIRVAIFDDNQARRESLQALIGLVTGLEWAGSFENCAQIIKDIDLSHPDIILMDLEMPVVNGI